MNDEACMFLYGLESVRTSFVCQQSPFLHPQTELLQCAILPGDDESA